MNISIPPQQLALDIAGRSNGHERYQIGAVLVDRAGRIFSWGWSHPAYHKPSIHAEHHAISRANPSRLAGSVCYVAGLRRYKGTVIVARPCQDCASRLRRVGIRHVRYTTGNNEWKGEILE